MAEATGVWGNKGPNEGWLFGCNERSASTLRLDEDSPLAHQQEPGVPAGPTQGALHWRSESVRAGVAISIANLTSRQEALAERHCSWTAPQTNDLLCGNRTIPKVGCHVRKAASCRPSFAVIQ